MFVFNDRKVRGYESGRTDVPPGNNMWRVLYLLGNPWVHNALADLGRAGLTFAELRYFLSRDIPKRTGIHSKLRDVKDLLADEPVLGFHLPPYSGRTQLATDLNKLKRAGFVVHESGEWCLRLTAYWDIVHEWERERDLELIRRYRGSEVIRVDHHARLYGLPRSLLTDGERRDLADLADDAGWLLAAAFQVEHHAKVRAWRKARRELESGALPAAVSSRILNLFWFWEHDFVLPDRIWQPDTPRLVTSEMLQIKDAQLMRRRMKGTISEDAFADTAAALVRKYTDLATRPRPVPTAAAGGANNLEVPNLVPEPPVSSPEEEAFLRDTLEYVCEHDTPEGERADRLEDLVRRGARRDLLKSLRTLWATSRTNITLVATSPIIPIVEDPTYAFCEGRFVDRLNGRRPPARPRSESDRAPAEA